jgi:hypothetical protein
MHIQGHLSMKRIPQDRKGINGECLISEGDQEEFMESRVFPHL